MSYIHSRTSSHQTDRIAWFWRPGAIKITLVTLLVPLLIPGCATQSGSSGAELADGWTRIATSSAPVEMSLPWATLKPVRARQRQLDERDEVITEISLSHRGRSHPIVTLVLQEVQSSEHAFIKLNNQSNPLEARIRGLLGANVDKVGTVRGASNQLGRVEFLDYTTTRQESCVGFRQYTGLAGAGKKIKQGVLLGTRMLLGLYCESGTTPVSRDRLSTLLGAYRLR